jgi:prolyl 4-hydroxylase
MGSLADESSSLSQRARAGDVRAMATWGRMLVTGEGGGVVTVPLMRDGVALLRAAAQCGDPEAPAVLAMMAALGMLQPRDFGAALHLLETAAQRGWAPAQAQLRILARTDGDQWSALRPVAADVALSPPPSARLLNERPRLRVIEKFATPAECEWLIARARDHLERAEVYLASDNLEVSEVRTNSEAYLMPKLLDVVTAAMLHRAAAAVGIDLAFCEFATVLHYKPGELFGPHVDFFDPGAPSQRTEIIARGQRIATFLLYLNDDYEGGETEFLDAGVKYKGRKGDAMYFVNVEPSGMADVLSRHQGSAPTRGEKWVLSQWVRSSPLNAYMTPGAERAALPPTWLHDAWRA